MTIPAWLSALIVVQTLCLFGVSWFLWRLAVRYDKLLNEYSHVSWQARMLRKELADRHE